MLKFKKKITQEMEDQLADCEMEGVDYAVQNNMVNVADFLEKESLEKFDEALQIYIEFVDKLNEMMQDLNYESIDEE